jgi:hypothetical protein
MPNDIMYCNSFEVSHNKEAFCMIFKFQKPDGSEIRIYVVTSPQGCKTLLNVTAAEMTEYETQYGKVEAWGSPKNTSTPNAKNGAPIYT